METHDVEAMSTRELQQAIRERDEARKALEEAREELDETSEMLDKTMDERNARGVIIREYEESLAAMEKELAELKARPVEVAEAKLAAAGEADKAEADRLRVETEQLRKQLAMSNQATVVFKLRFMAWQQAHQQMSEAFTALDEETKEKMRAAIRAQVKAWGWTDE